MPKKCAPMRPDIQNATDAVWRTLHEQGYVDEPRPDRDSSWNLWALLASDIEDALAGAMGKPGGEE